MTDNTYVIWCHFKEKHSFLNIIAKRIAFPDHETTWVFRIVTLKV